MKQIETIGFYLLDYPQKLTEKEQKNTHEIGVFQVSDDVDLVARIIKAYIADLEHKYRAVEEFAPLYLSYLPPVPVSVHDFFYPPKDGVSQNQNQHREIFFTQRNIKTYLSALQKTQPELSAFFFTRLAFRLPESARKKHTYIVAGSGSGKSELLKVLMYSYIARSERDTSIVLLDPHGDIALQVARWKQHQDAENLIYLDADLKKGFTPCINPLEMPDTSDPQAVNYMAECLTEVFKEIVGAESSLTANMETLLKSVLTVLLIRQGSTLEDLQTFMRDEENAELVDYAIDHSPRGQRHFFRTAFYDKNYTPTKKALYTKLQSLLNSDTFYNLVIGKSTIDLKQAIDSKKTIIFNLSKGSIGQKTAPAFGRFIMGLLQGYAFQRQKIPEKNRVPTHVFIDEFQNFVTPSIETVLAEARKYALHLTLAQQFYGQGTSTALRGAILNNTAVKIAGTGEGTSLEAIAKVMTGADKTALQNCETGKFYIKVKKQHGLIQQAFGTENARPFKVTTKLLGFNNSMSAKKWQKVKAYQIEHYYHPIGNPETTTQAVSGIDRKEITTSTSKTPESQNLGLLAGMKKKGVALLIKSTKEKRPSWLDEKMIPGAKEGKNSPGQNIPGENQRKPSSPQTLKKTTQKQIKTLDLPLDALAPKEKPPEVRENQPAKKPKYPL